MVMLILAHPWALWAHLGGWTAVVVVVGGSALDRLSEES